MNLLTFTVVTITCLTLQVLCADIGVPVLLWHSKLRGHELDEWQTNSLFDGKSTVHQLDARMFGDDYLAERPTIVAFVQNRLSLEQFTGDDERRLTAIRRVLSDPSVEQTLLTDVLNPTEALDTRHFRRQQWPDIHVHKGSKVWIELPEPSLAENNDVLSELLDSIAKNVSTGETLFMITGLRNQFTSIDLESELEEGRSARVARDVGKADEPVSTEAPNVDADDRYLSSLDDCLYFFVTGLTVKYANMSKDVTTHVPVLVDGFNGSTWTIFNDSRCWNIAGNETALLHLNYDGYNGTEMTLRLEIDAGVHNHSTSAFWYVKDGSVTLNNTVDKELGLDGVVFPLITNRTISSEQRFCYSCSQITLQSVVVNNTQPEPSEIKIAISFHRLQLQPFRNPRNTTKRIVFTDSNDCQVWMTMSLWMGLLTLIVLFFILAVGVYLLSTINTPDRFENPKAKPLMLGNFDE